MDKKCVPYEGTISLGLQNYVISPTPIGIRMAIIKMSQYHIGTYFDKPLPNLKVVFRLRCRHSPQFVHVHSSPPSFIEVSNDR